jgi:hypothetical protein
MYASRTGTRRNLDAMARCGWRLLVSARGVLRNEGFRYALDNGAWTAFQKQEPFDVPAFAKAVDLLGAGADWVVVPDVVGDREGTLRAADEWLPRLAGLTLYIAVQDGMTAIDLDRYPGAIAGVFVGGSTEWKLRTSQAWRAATRERGMLLHVARVNTERRIAFCRSIGATSIDGSSASRFAVNTPRLDNSRRRPIQGMLGGDSCQM